MPTIVHFQISSDDIERSKKFYNDLFGWKFDKFPSSPSSEPMPEGMEYWMISTVEQQRITNYFEVKSVQEYSAKAEQLGGRVNFQNIRCQVWVILLYVQIQRIMALGLLKQIKLLNE